LRRLSTEDLRDVCGAVDPGEEGEIGDMRSNELVDLEAVVEIELLETWLGYRGGRGDSTGGGAEGVFMEEEDERRKNGMWEGVRRFDVDARAGAASGAPPAIRG
jgi:hypothetical protein